MIIKVRHSPVYIFSHFDTKRQNRRITHSHKIRDPQISRNYRKFNCCQIDKIVSEFNMLNLCNLIYARKREKKKMLRTYMHYKRWHNDYKYLILIWSFVQCMALTKVMFWYFFFSCKNEELVGICPRHKSRSRFKKLQLAC